MLDEGEGMGGISLTQHDLSKVSPLVSKAHKCAGRGGWGGVGRFDAAVGSGFRFLFDGWLFEGFPKSLFFDLHSFTYEN